MIRETTTSLDPTWGELVDVDVLDTAQWAGLFRADNRMFLRTIDCCIPLPDQPRFTLIRHLDEHRIVIADRRAQPGKANAWVMSITDVLPRAFNAGDGLQDVLAGGDTIVVTYFDEGIFSGTSPADQGVAVFSSTGALQTGYRSQFGPVAVDIADCYAACWVGDSQVAFLPYTSFQLVTWDLPAKAQRVLRTPPRVHGASAIAATRDATLFFSPNDGRHDIVEWSHQGKLSVIGRHHGPLRGLRGGRFIAHGASGFTIVEKAR